MHELRIAEDLSRIVIEVATKEKLSKVTAVNLSFGRLTAIVPEIFESAFREAVRDSISENAEVFIEIIPVKLKCCDCGNEYEMGDNNFLCYKCNSARTDIINGKELFVKSIEGE